MPRDKDPELRALLLNETTSAIKVSKIGGGAQAAEHWIPRSLIGYLRKDKTAAGAVHVVFTLPEWFVEKKDCWDLMP